MPVGGTWGPCHRAESSALDAAQTPDGLFGDSIGDPSSGICWDEAVVVECDKARVDGDEIFLGHLTQGLESREACPSESKM